MLKQQLAHVSPVSRVSEFTEAKRKTYHQVFRTSFELCISQYSEELCNTSNCIVKTFETLIVCSAFCYNAGSDKQRLKRGWKTGC